MNVNKNDFDDFFKDDENEFELLSKKPKKVDFFDFLDDFSAGDKKHHHNGICDGDCDNCPSHYGYRYGRWYYGKDHTHGCEFGGNKGGGGII